MAQDVSALQISATFGSVLRVGSNNDGFGSDTAAPPQPLADSKGRESSLLIGYSDMVLRRGNLTVEAGRLILPVGGGGGAPPVIQFGATASGFGLLAGSEPLLRFIIEGADRMDLGAARLRLNAGQLELPPASAGAPSLVFSSSEVSPAGLHGSSDNIGIAVGGEDVFHAFSGALELRTAGDDAIRVLPDSITLLTQATPTVEVDAAGVTLPQADDVLRLPDGTEAEPALRFGDPATGLRGVTQGAVPLVGHDVRLVAHGLDRLIASTDGITLPQPTDRLTLPQGSTARPSLHWGDDETGIWGESDTVRIVSSGEPVAVWRAGVAHLGPYPAGTVRHVEITPAGVEVVGDAQTLTLPSGTAAAPSLRWETPSTGIRGGGGSLHLATAGVDRLMVDAGGEVGVTSWLHVQPGSLAEPSVRVSDTTTGLHGEAVAGGHDLVLGVRGVESLRLQHSDGRAGGAPAGAGQIQPPHVLLPQGGVLDARSGWVRAGIGAGAGNPSISVGDVTSGLYSSAPGEVSLAIQGTQALRAHEPVLDQPVITIPRLVVTQSASLPGGGQPGDVDWGAVAHGTQAAPGLRFSGDAADGWYRSEASTTTHWRYAYGGSDILAIRPQGLYIAPRGSTAAPALLMGPPGTSPRAGMWVRPNDGTGGLQIVWDGQEGPRLDRGISLPWPGNVLRPAIDWITAQGGIYAYPGAGGAPPGLGVTTQNALRLRIDSGGLDVLQDLMVDGGAHVVGELRVDGGLDALFADGSESAPSIAFVGEPGLGLYRGAGDVLGIAAGGRRVAQVGGDGLAVIGEAAEDRVSLSLPNWSTYRPLRWAGSLTGWGARPGGTGWLLDDPLGIRLQPASAGTRHADLDVADAGGVLRRARLRGSHGVVLGGTETGSPGSQLIELRGRVEIRDAVEFSNPIPAELRLMPANIVLRQSLIAGGGLEVRVNNVLGWRVYDRGAGNIRNVLGEAEVLQIHAANLPIGRDGRAVGEMYKSDNANDETVYIRRS